VFLLGTTITVAIAALSFTYIETPLRQGRATFSWCAFGRRARIPGSTASLATIAAALVVLTGGLAFAVTTDAGGSGRAVTIDIEDFAAPVADPGNSDAPAMERIQSVVMIGDSIAILLGAFSDIQGLTVDVRGFPGCGFLSADERYIEGTWKAWDAGCNDGPIRYVEGIPDFDATMLVWGRWDLSDVKWKGATYSLGTPEYETYLFGQLDNYQHAAEAASKPLYITSALCFDGGLDYLSAPRPEQMNELLKAYSRLHDNVYYLPLIDFVCRDGKPVKVNGEELRPDTVHFSPEATSLLWQWLLPYMLGTKDAKADLEATTGG
jgi:hypothetical protein